MIALEKNNSVEVGFVGVAGVGCHSSLEDSNREVSATVAVGGKPLGGWAVVGM